MTLTSFPVVIAALLAVSQEPGRLGTSSSIVAPASARAGRLQVPGDLRANRGQWPAEVLFFATSGSVGATLLEDALVFQSLVRERGEPLPPPFALRLPGKPRAVEGLGPSPARYHYLLASGSASDVQGFERVVYRDVQPGIDVQVRRDGASFAYDLLVEPGADLEAFVLELEGVDSVRIEGAAELVMEVAGEPVVQRIGACWQVDPASGARQPVACRFRLIEGPGDAKALGFEVPARDPSRALVIDPSLLYATYLGGPHQELLVGFAVDPAGANYLLADVTADAPTTPGSYQPSPLWIAAAYLAKISADGSTLEWATYLGGSGSMRGADVAVDTDGTVVVVGTTWAGDFPTTAGALQLTTNSPGLAEVFVSRLDATGSSLVWSTLFGGSGQDQGKVVALFPSGDVLVAIEPWSADVAATPGAFDTVKDPDDKMVLRISADGSQLVFATFFHTGRILDMAIDATSNVYLGGDTNSSTGPLPTTPGAFQESKDPGDSKSGFLAKLDPLGTQVIWCTYLGGSAGFDTVWGIAVDAASAVYVGGSVDSDDFPVTPGAFVTDPVITGDGGAGFAAKLLSDGSGLVWSTFIGGCCGGGGFIGDVAVDTAGNLHTTGSTNEPGWPTTPDAFQSFGGGPSSDMFLTKFDTFGEKLVYSTMFGGNSTDYQGQIELDGAGNPHIAGYTSSSSAPVTPGAAQTTYGGGGDFILAAFDVPLLRWRTLGNGLHGSKAPNLAGAGPLAPGSTTRLSVRGGMPSGAAWFVAGLAEVQLPFFGGVLHPSADVIAPVTLDPAGALDFTFAWPNNSAVDIWFQLWQLDPGAPFLLSATNALLAGGSN